MAVMLSRLYDALRAAHVPEDQAREAAEEVAGYEASITALRADVARLDARVTLVTWMVGANTGLTLLVLGVLLRLVGT